MSTNTMASEARISSRIDAELKEQGDSILAEIGLKPSQAISLFYTQIVRQRGLPFELKLPNADTLDAIEEVRDPKFRKKAKRYASAKELMADLDD